MISTNNDTLSVDSNTSFRSSPIGSRSTTLRERRAKHIEQEKLLRSRMNRIGSPDSSGGIMSSGGGSFASLAEDDGSVESSLLSMNISRSSGNEDKSKKELKWEKVYVEFTFGLLTFKHEAPKNGQYHNKRWLKQSNIDDNMDTRSSSTKLLDESPILKHIMNKVGEVSNAAVQNRSGNVIIITKSPFVKSVVRDESYKAPHDRPEIVRCFVKATAPIQISDLNGPLTRSSQIISKVIIKEALIEGVKRKIFDH